MVVELVLLLPIWKEIVATPVAITPVVLEVLQVRLHLSQVLLL